MTNTRSLQVWPGGHQCACQNAPPTSKPIPVQVPSRPPRIYRSLHRAHLHLRLHIRLSVPRPTHRARSTAAITIPASPPSFSIFPTSPERGPPSSVSNASQPIYCIYSDICTQLSNLHLTPRPQPTSLHPSNLSVPLPSAPYTPRSRSRPHSSHNDSTPGPTRNPRTNLLYDPYDIARRVRDTGAILDLPELDIISIRECFFFLGDLNYYLRAPSHLRWKEIAEWVEWDENGDLVPRYTEVGVFSSSQTRLPRLHPSRRSRRHHRSLPLRRSACCHCLYRHRGVPRRQLWTLNPAALGLTGVGFTGRRKQKSLRMV